MKRKLMLSALLTVITGSVSAAQLSLGYGLEKNIYIEAGSISEGLGGFMGMTINLDDLDDDSESLQNSTEDDKTSGDIMSFYLGPNYSVKLGDFTQTYGIGADAVIIDKIENTDSYQDADDVDWTLRLGGIAKYNLTYRRVTFGFAYRTHNKEMAFSIGIAN